MSPSSPTTRFVIGRPGREPAVWACFELRQCGKLPFSGLRGCSSRTADHLHLVLQNLQDMATGRCAGPCHSLRTVGGLHKWCSHQVFVQVPGDNFTASCSTWGVTRPEKTAAVAVISRRGGGTERLPLSLEEETNCIFRGVLQNGEEWK